MFYINKDTELTTDLLRKMFNKFTLSVQPQLHKWQKQYNGQHDILNKIYSDPSKKSNNIVTNFCKVITDTYAGYIVGKPVTYTSNDDITEVQECINYNDDSSANMQWLRNALIYSKGYELQWLDSSAKIRYSQINPLNCFTVRSNDLEKSLLYFIRWYDADNFDDTDLKYIEIYSSTSKKTYKSLGSLGGNLEFISEEMHYFKDVPVSVFDLTETNENIFDCIIGLNDAFNELLSAEIDDFTAWVDAYLKLTGVDADSSDIAEMKANRVLVLPEGANADWLLKNANDTQIVNMLSTIKENIFKITACPDMADETFLAQSGTALAYKLVGFENIAASIVANFKKAIQRRIELICNILNLKATEAVWRDININFVRNLPVNTTEIIQIINTLKGTVSDKTLLAQLPFIDDIEAELEAVQAQKQANMELYSFGIHTHTDEEIESDTEE